MAEKTVGNYSNTVSQHKTSKENVAPRKSGNSKLHQTELLQFIFRSELITLGGSELKDVSHCTFVRLP